MAVRWGIGEGRKFRVLRVIDEVTREALAIRVARKLGSTDLIDVLADLFPTHVAPAHIRLDQGPDFIDEPVETWIAAVGTKTACIGKASTCAHG